LCGAAQSSNMLIAARAIAGIGASGLVNGTLTMIAIILPLNKRPGRAGQPNEGIIC
jgi:MFS family permease